MDILGVELAHTQVEDESQDPIKPPCPSLMGFMAHAAVDARRLGDENPAQKQKIMAARQQASSICARKCKKGLCMNEMGGDGTTDGDHLARLIISCVDLRGQELDPEVEDSPYWELGPNDFDKPVASAD